MNQLTFPILLALMSVLLITSGCAKSVPPLADLPAPAQLAPNSGFPDVLTTYAGQPVTTSAQWQEQRVPELKQLFQHYMYGFMPAAPDNVRFSVDRTDTILGGKATMKQITVTFGPKGTPPIHLLLVVPKNRTGPVPAFLGLNFDGNHTVLDDRNIALTTAWIASKPPQVVDNKATDAGRGKSTDGWCIENSIDRGYAVATFYYGDVMPDRNVFGDDSVIAHYFKPGQTQRADSDWGAIAAWAWGLHRAMDYLCTDSDIDKNRVAVFGHSRNGKAALLAGAFDSRFALVLPHQAGEGGTAPSRKKPDQKGVETVKAINDRFPHWFDGLFKQFSDDPTRLPFDQHAMIALCAPRPVLITTAQDDVWSDPQGQFEMLTLADRVYRLLGAQGISQREFPELNKLVDSRLGFWYRPGKHSTTKDDWAIFIQFAEKHMKK